MVCIYNPSAEQVDALDRYSRILGSEEAAYYVLSQNNGFPLDKTPNGDDSDLYQDLLNHYGNEEEAIRTKSMMYTQRFFDANGDWTMGTMYDPSIYDSKGEPNASYVLNTVSGDMQAIMNHQFLLDANYPTIEEDDLSRISPTDNLSDYAVDQLIRESYSQYTEKHRSEYKKNNPNATEDELAEQEIIASRQWYSRKVDKILNEQVRALATAFDLVYIQHPNGSIELQSKGREAFTHLKHLRIKFLNNIIHDPLEDELRTQILSKVDLSTGTPRRVPVGPLSKEFTLSVPGAKDYINEALVQRRKNDKMIAACTLINISLTGGTATTVNKALAYHYITMFINTPLIQAGLEAVRDRDDRSDLYLVNKLVDIITTPAIVGSEKSSLVGRVFDKGVTQETFDNFWDEFDDLIHEVITKGVKSEEAKKKILSVVTAAFITNDRYNLWNGSFPYMSTSPIDYYAQWYAVKYKPWSQQDVNNLSEIEQFFNQLETYYQNKIKRQERDYNISAEQTTRTSLALQFLQKSDTVDPTSQEELFKNLFDLAYQEIRDATVTIQNLHSISGINDRFSRLGSMYSDTISFYNYILNTQLTSYFDPDTTKFPKLVIVYNRITNMLNKLNGLYKTKLYDISCQFVDQYIDKHLDANQVTDEMIRNAKQNAHLELKNAAIYGDLKNYELWITMNSLSKSHVVRITHNSLNRLNATRDDETRFVAQQLQKALDAAKKSLLKGGLTWAGYRFTPKNFQMLFMERYDDGTPSGMFVRKRHYGNFFKRRAELIATLVENIERDVQNKTGNIYYKLDLDDYGNPIFPDGDEWEDYWREYQHAVNDFECHNGHKRFLQEYYDLRIDNLSRKAIALQDSIQNSIDIIEDGVTEDDVFRPDRLTVEERRQLQDLYRQQDNLGNEYTLLGEKKTGEDLEIAHQISAFRKLIKDRVLYDTDWQKYEDAKAKVDPNELSEFEKWSTNREINPEFWQIYKVLQKEYRDQFPAHFYSLFEDIEKLVKERGDIVDTVKFRKGYAMPDLRKLPDSAWKRVKEIDDELEDLYTPIVEYLKTLGDAAIPSAFKQICRLDEVMDSKDTNSTAFDALMDEARAIDAQESLLLGTQVHTHEDEAYDKYTRRVLTSGGWRYIPLSIFSYMTPSVFPEDVKARFNIDDSFQYVVMLPNRKYNKMVDPESDRYVEPSLVNPLYDPNEDSYIQPTELNPTYDILKNEAPKEVFKLYELCMKTKQNADAYLPISAKLKYFLPQLRASDLSIISRIMSIGLGGVIQECVTNKFIANETDEDILDDFTTLPDGTRVNSVPLKFVDKLKDQRLLTSDVVGSLVLYYHMAANYHYKQEVEQLYQALLQQLGQDSSIVTADGSSHLILGKTTNQYAKEKNVVDNLLYEQKQLWGERGSQKITGRQKTFIKTAKFFAKLGTIAALSRNILSQTTGFFDAAGKLHSFAFAGDAFNVKDLIQAIATFDKYLVSGRLFAATGEVLPDNMIAAMMQKNNVGTEIRHKYQGGFKSQLRRFIGMERSGMGGFRISDYSITAVIALCIYRNYRLLDDEFLPERSFKGKLYKKGYSYKEINEMYDSALNLLDAYEYKNSIFSKGKAEFEMKDHYKQLLGEKKLAKLEQDIMIAIQAWAPKLNGAVPDADKAVIQQNILAGFTVALRSYLINEMQTRFINGEDFQDPNMSKQKLEVLESRRKALAKVYKNILTDNKKKTKLQKLFDERSRIEQELLNLKSSGDINVINWHNIFDAVGLAAGEGTAGFIIGNMLGGTIGAYVGAGIGLIQAGANIYTNRKQSSGNSVNIFRSKIHKLDLELRSINEQIRAYEASEDRDLLLMEIQQINEEIIRIKNKMNENQGIYDYSRNMYTNGSNRLAGRLILNLAKKAQYYINTMLPDRFKSLSPKYNPKITQNQIKGLKRIAYDLVRLSEWWLLTTFMLSWYRYDDGRAFLGGSFNDATTQVMHAGDDAMNSVITPVMNSNIWKDFWNDVRASSINGTISYIPYVHTYVENKADAMLGYEKKVSRKTKNVSRVKVNAVKKQTDFLKAYGAVQSLKTFTEGIAPYDYQTINDLTNAVSATINVMTKSVEGGQKMLAEQQQGILQDPMQGGPYAGYFTREEYGAAHSWQRPFGYPATFEQTTEIGLVNRMNYLSNTGINRFIIPKKEVQHKDKKKKKSMRHPRKSR